MAKRSVRKKPGRARKGSFFSFSGNIYAVTFLRLLTVLVFFFLCRLLFYLFNVQYFSNLSTSELLSAFFYGIRFDLSGLFMINGIYLILNTVPFTFRYNRIYSGFVNAGFYVVNTIGFALNFIDTVYFRFTMKRTTFDIFSYLRVGGDLDRLIPQFARDFWYLILLWIVFSVVFVFICTRFRTREPSGKGKSFSILTYVWQSVVFVFSLGLIVLCIRGGVQFKPIEPVSAGLYTSARNAPLLLNTPFTLIKTVSAESLQPVRWFKTEAELNKIYSPVFPPSEKKFRRMNVMVIIMESFSREHIGALNQDKENGRYQGYTPFFDSLLRAGWYFDAYANGKTSMQGVPAILSSIPSLMNESFIQSNHGPNRYTGLGGLLGGKGYHTAFFHGGSNGTMSLDIYARIAGFQRYYGRKEYGNEKHYDGRWGIRDEEFFQYTARILSGMPKPFAVALFSLSSHHPYFVPGQYRHKFRTGKLPIQQSVMYADYALGKFFHAVKNKPWFKNTLFVITADHTSEGYFPCYQTTLGSYAIPVLLYAPGDNLRGKGEVVAQQTDILPTILNYIGYDRSFIAFGSDLFNPKAPHFSVHYLGGIYGMVKEGYYIEFDGEKATSLYDMKNDPLQQRDILTSEPVAAERLTLFLKAYIQQYNNRLTENRLIID